MVGVLAGQVSALTKRKLVVQYLSTWVNIRLPGQLLVICPTYLTTLLSPSTIPSSTTAMTLDFDTIQRMYGI